MRWLLALLICAGTPLLLVLVWSGSLSLFSPVDGDATNGAYYVLSTVAQTLGAILGMGVALLFVSLQLVQRPAHSRLLREAHWSGWSVGALAFLGFACCVSVAALARLGHSMAAMDFRLIDTALILGGASILGLVVLVLQQLESANPAHVADILVRRITTQAILRYGLVKRVKDGEGGVRFGIQSWNARHGSSDPLAAFHEVMMLAVEKHDRVLLSHLNRLLLQKIALYRGCYYGLDPQASIKPAFKVPLETWLRCRRRPSWEARVLAVHFLHYVIRRSMNLVREWDGRDVVRQAFVRDLMDLVDALSACGSENAAVMNLATYAILHVSLAYRSVARYGRVEPTIEAFQLAAKLNARGCSSSGTLLARVLGALSVRVPRIPEAIAEECLRQFSPELVTVYQESVALAEQDAGWLPADTDDPWHEFLYQRRIEASVTH